jgi:hypothetical protein
VELDHVLIAVIDLAAAARAFEEHCGLASVEGGRHPGWGTANRIVPLGSAYLELIAIVDEAVASDSPFGRWVAEGATPVGRPIGWAVRPADLDDVARRLGLTVTDGSRMTPTGELLHWRSAGVDQAVAEPALPFFMDWGATRLPGETAVTHPAAPVAIVQLEMEGDPDRLATWLGDHDLPIVVRAGRPGVVALRLSTGMGEVVLRGIARPKTGSAPALGRT